MTVTATLTVNFELTGSDADGLLTLLVDDRETGLNGGKTSGFFPGDSVYILRFKSSGLMITNQGTTAGSLSAAGSGNYAVEEVVTFTGNREVSLQLPVSGGFSYTWLGRNPGSIQVVNNNKLIIPENDFGMARVTYQSSYTAYRLHAVPVTIDQVFVWSQGEL